MSQTVLGIAGVEYALPSNRVSNDDLLEENPDWDMDRLAERTGVYERPVAAPGETAYDFGLTASRRLIENVDISPDAIDAIIFCTQTPDHIMPPNACMLQRDLGLRDDTFACDITLACSGYIYGLSIAEGLLAAGRAEKVLLVTGDTYTRLIHPKDRATRCLFGDGSAASLLTPMGPSEGLIDLRCGTAGRFADRFLIPAGGARHPRTEATAVENVDRFGNVRTAEHISMNGMGVLAFANEFVPQAVSEILDANGFVIDDIDLLIFHQASRIALDSLSRRVNIDSERVYDNIARRGNLVSASIPVALCEAIREHRIVPGSLVLLCGFGVGLSWGCALIRIPEACVLQPGMIDHG